MKKIGFILNPLAGIGGKVGLKGSDGDSIAQRAFGLGAKKESHLKAKRALEGLAGAKGEFLLLTYPGEMGEDLARSCGLQPEVLGEAHAGQTTGTDTEQAARDMQAAGAELILFAGGDGTARNILDAVGDTLPVIGVPAGCKIYSAAYALNPEKAGELALKCLRGEVTATKRVEVLDIDEERFRQNDISLKFKLYGYLRVPEEPQLVQKLKAVAIVNEDEVVRRTADYLIEQMEADTLYLVGSGSTTTALMERLGLPNTMLGVDLVYNKKLLASDANEQMLLDTLGRYEKVKLIVTVIGGQGYLFGRGNQQLSAEVLLRIGKENIIVMAARSKMEALESHRLYVDTGNAEVNRKLSGPYKITVGYQDFMVFDATG